MLQGFDVEAQRRRDGADVFSIKFLEDRRLPSVVKPAAMNHVREETCPLHLLMVLLLVEASQELTS